MSPETFEAALELIASGKSLRYAAEMLGFHRNQFHRAVDADAALRDQYMRAREAQAEFWADEIIEIADNSALTPDDKRVRLDARKWAAGKGAPKKYGDKIDVAHTGAVDLHVTAIDMTIVDPVADAKS